MVDRRPTIERYWDGVKNSEEAGDVLGALRDVIALLDESTTYRNELVARALAAGDTWDDIAVALDLADGSEAYLLLGGLA